ncbi:uncharacterized protein LAJ45_11296 [Morchella importuna]|uniref:uncharacterized protein n=1 Tax=Morchella importuna TaxID=1174673 RepID=UPI001E8EEFFB|nr:uncharacterized protein LAJ45_11296 [Morchella importuna]KAH8144702.1 hypothetical protein LAJ45_11296 [Morchella importuna]
MGPLCGRIPRALVENLASTIIQSSEPRTEPVGPCVFMRYHSLINTAISIELFMKFPGLLVIPWFCRGRVYSVVSAVADFASVWY